MLHYKLDHKYIPIIDTFFSPAFGISAAAGQVIAWLLSNALNLSATVGDDAVMAVGSDTTARVYDSVTGLSLATVSAGNPVSEGMRLSYDTDEAATVGVELWDNTGVTVQAGWTNNLDGTFTGASAAGFVFKNPICEVGLYYQIEFEILEYTSGTVQVAAGNTGLGTARSSVGLFSEVVQASGNTIGGVNAPPSFTGKIGGISIKEVLPTFLNSIEPLDVEVVTNSEFSTASDWSAHNNATVTITGGTMLVETDGVLVPNAYQPG
jgi:hypothetical protein